MDSCEQVLSAASTPDPNNPLPNPPRGDCETFSVLSPHYTDAGASLLEDGTPCLSNGPEVPLRSATFGDFEECMNRSEEALHEVIGLGVGTGVYKLAISLRPALKLSWRIARIGRAMLVVDAFHVGYKIGSAGTCWYSLRSPIPSPVLLENP
jgi:hypothetical protein